jgi:WD40 repeat protein
MLASGSGDATVRVWDISSGSLLLELPRHDSYILQLQFTEGGLHLISRTPTSTYTWDISALAVSTEEAVGVLLNKQSEHNERDKGYMSGVSQGYYFSMGDKHRVFMGKGRRVGLVGAVQEEYRITGFAFHTDRVVFACTDGSIVILDVSRLKQRLDEPDD